MPKKAIDILKSFFETGDRPTQEQFADLIDSFHHKDGAALINSKSYDPQTGAVNIQFTDNSSLNFTIPTSLTIAQIVNLQEELDNKVDKVAGKGLSANDFTNYFKNLLSSAGSHINDTDAHVSAQDRATWNDKVNPEAGKGLSTNDYTNEEAQKVADAVAHAQDDGRHLTAEAIANFSQNLRAYEIGEEFFDTSLNVHRVFEDEIYKFDEDTATFPFVSTDFATELAAGAWVKILNNAKAISPYNMILKGLATQIPTLNDFADICNRVENRVAGGTMRSNFYNYIEDYVKSFFIIDNDVYLSVIRPIRINFNTNNTGDLTHLYDFGGNLIFSINFSNFQNLKEIFSPSITDLILNNCPELQYVYCPLLKILGGGSDLPKFKFENFFQPQLKEFYPNFKTGGTTNQPVIMPEDYLPNATFINTQDFFSSLNFEVVNFPNMKKLRGNFCRFASQITEFNAPEVVDIGTQCFWGANGITKLNFEKCLYVGADNGVNTFNMNSIEVINIPNCIQLGSSTDAVNSVFSNINNGCIINVSEVLKTSNNGDPDPDLVYAIEQRGCTVNYITKAPKSFDNETIDITNTYADDAAAASGGVQIGQRYVATTGVIMVRLS